MIHLDRRRRRRIAAFRLAVGVLAMGALAFTPAAASDTAPSAVGIKTASARLAGAQPVRAIKRAVATDVQRSDRLPDCRNNWCGRYVVLFLGVGY
jgi:hypothetical protein